MKTCPAAAKFCLDRQKIASIGIRFAEIGKQDAETTAAGLEMVTAGAEMATAVLGFSEWIDSQQYSPTEIRGIRGPL